MLKNIFLSISFFTASLCSYSQNEGLIIMNNTTKKTKLIRTNSRLTYILFEEAEYNTGIVKKLLDSSVVINSDTVKIKNIAGIRRKSFNMILLKIIGIPTMVLGSLILGDGLAYMYANPKSLVGAKIFLLGTGVFTLGVIPFLQERGDYSFGNGGKWSIKLWKKNSIHQ